MFFSLLLFGFCSFSRISVASTFFVCIEVRFFWTNIRRVAQTKCLIIYKSATKSKYIHCFYYLLRVSYFIDFLLLILSFCPGLSNLMEWIYYLKRKKNYYENAECESCRREVNKGFFKHWIYGWESK